MSKLFVDEIVHQSSQGSGTITLGASGETITTASGAKFSGITGQNYPAFEAKRPQSAQVVTDNTNTKVQFSTEIFDTDNCYDNSTNYRFTPTVAGKYWCYGQTGVYGGGVDRVSQVQTRLKKNGSTVFYNSQDLRNSKGRQITSSIGVLIDFNGSSDYLEMHCYIGLINTSGSQITGDSSLTYFGAYKILT